AGLAVAAGLIALIGGRLVPNFTGNWLAAQGLAPGPAAFGRVDQAVLALTGVALAGWVFAPLASPVGVLLIAVGGGHLLRLARWRGWKTASEPLVWILHAGYGWLGLGLALLGASVLAPDLAPRSAGVHAIAVGAVGVMTLAVMTRATLGHTGRPLAADRWTLGVYLAILLAAVARVSAALDPSHASLLLGLSAGLWATAFLGFALRYGPMLVLPRRVAPLRT
ncbi:MAG: NnrS family protein, partial [Phenylobacterium sp.]